MEKKVIGPKIKEHYDFETRQEAVNYYYADGELGSNDDADRLEEWLEEQLIKDENE